MKNIKSLLCDFDNIKKVLEYFGYCNIRLRNKETKDISCSMHEGGNPNRISIKLEGYIPAYDFVESFGGDIISLIMKHRNLKFKEVIDAIKMVLNIDDSSLDFSREKNTFLSLFEKLDKRKEKKSISDIKEYPEEILLNYSNSWNTKFLQDNISIKIQREFEIGFDEITNRITIVWRGYDGELIGVMGRSIDPDAQNKYLPLFPFKKSYSLYGYAENYMDLIGNHIFVGEAEKFVLQMATYGYRNALALGCSNLSGVQIEKILELNPKSIIFCFDEGLNEEVILRNLKELKKHISMKDINVYLILDKENKYMKLGSKCSPTDLGKETWEHIKKECVLKIR